MEPMCLAQQACVPASSAELGSQFLPLRSSAVRTHVPVVSVTSQLHGVFQA